MDLFFLLCDPPDVVRLVFYFTDVFDLMFFSVYWDYAMTIPLEEIVYLHCHQQGGSTQSFALIPQLSVCVFILSFLFIISVYN